jgi:ATP-dependent Lon protease
LVVHFILLSILFYSSGRSRRLSLPPVYTVDILAKPASIEKRPAVKKKMAPAKKVRRKPVAQKQSNKTSVKKEKSIAAKKAVKVSPPPEKLEKIVIKERENLPTEDTQLEEAFKAIKETDITQKQDIRTDIAQLEAKLRLKQKELKIKSALKKFKKSTNLEDEIKSTSPKTKEPLQNIEQETNTSSKIQEDIEKLNRERRLKNREDKIKEAFSKLKEKQINEDVKKIIKKKEDSNLPVYNPKEWSFDIKGEKGLSARFRTGEISDEEAISIAKIIGERIESAWKVDEFLTMHQDYSSLTSIVSINVGHDGKILGVTVEKKSENHAFHQSVMKAIEASDPLPLNELNMSGDFEIGLTFSP